MKIYEITFSPTGGTKKVADMLTREWACEIFPVDLMDSKGICVAWPLPQKMSW